MSLCRFCGEETYGSEYTHVCKVPIDGIHVRPGYLVNTTEEEKSWLDTHYRGLMLLGMALELLLLAALVAIEVWK